MDNLSEQQVPFSVSGDAQVAAGDATVTLNLYELTDEERQFRFHLDRSIMGQEKAKLMAMAAFRAYLDPERNPKKVIFAGFAAGPPGVGKTLTAQTLADYFHQDPEACLFIKGGTLADKSDLTRLIGAGPKWVGYKDPNEKTPEGQRDHSALLSAHNLITSRKGSKTPVTVVIFDEIEKACHEVKQALLAILDGGSEDMANNAEVSFGDCIFFFTTNVGNQDVEKEAKTRIGFPTTNVTSSSAGDGTILKRYEEQFSPEFRDRINMMVIFHKLDQKQLAQIVGLNIMRYQNRLIDKYGQTCFKLTVEMSARTFIRELAEKRGGARSVLRVLEQHLTRPVGTGIISNQLQSGHTLRVFHKPGELVLSFERTGVGQGKLTPLSQPGQSSLAGQVASPKTKSLLEKVQEFHEEAGALRANGKYDQAIKYLEAALLLLAESSDKDVVFWRSIILNQMGNNHFDSGNYALSIPIYRLAIFQRLEIASIKTVGRATALSYLYRNLSGAYLALGDKTKAEHYCIEGVALIRKWPSQTKEFLEGASSLCNKFKEVDPSRTEEMDKLLLELQEGRLK